MHSHQMRQLTTPCPCSSKDTFRDSASPTSIATTRDTSVTRRTRPTLSRTGLTRRLQSRRRCCNWQRLGARVRPEKQTCIKYPRRTCTLGYISIISICLRYGQIFVPFPDCLSVSHFPRTIQLSKDRIAQGVLCSYLDTISSRIPTYHMSRHSRLPKIRKRNHFLVQQLST